MERKDPRIHYYPIAKAHQTRLTRQFLKTVGCNRTLQPSEHHVRGARQKTLQLRYRGIEIVSKLRIVISLILIYDSCRFSVLQSIILILFASILVDTTNASPYIGIIINTVDVL